jgi:hypothetical protein
MSIFCKYTSNFALLEIFVVAYHSPSTRLNTENKWIELNILVGRQTMKNLIKFSAAVAAIAGVASVATAQSVVPFNGTSTVSGGVIEYSGGSSASLPNGTGTLLWATGITTNLSDTYGGAFSAGLYSIDFNTVTSLLTIKDSSNVTVLGGQMSVLSNNYSNIGAANGPVLNLDAQVSFTSGTWLDAIRQISAGSASGQGVTGYISLSGNNGSTPSGVDSVYLTASAVPEPGEWAAMGMLASGLGGLVIRARRRKLA